MTDGDTPKRGGRTRDGERARLKEREGKKEKQQEKEKRKSMLDNLAGRFSLQGMWKKKKSVKPQAEEEEVVTPTSSQRKEYQLQDREADDMLERRPSMTIDEQLHVLVHNFKEMVANEKLRREDPSYQHRYPRLASLVVGKYAMKFEAAMGIVIVTNCLCIGLKASYDTPTEDAEDGPLGPVFFALENIFTAIFCFELFLRLSANGWTWLFSWSNFADAMLVLIPGVLAVWILGIVFGIKASLLRTFTILRVFRLVRLAREVRLQPQFKEMWLLIRGLIDSLSTLFWTYVIISWTLYIFAIASVTLLARDADFLDDADVQQQFGGVLSSMFTLFQIMTLDSWTSIARPMMRKKYWVGWYIFFFISVGCFVLMNLITAVIVENAFAISKSDDEEQAKQKEIQRERDMAELTELFMDLDADQSGSLTREEFEQATKHPMIRRKFMMLDFGPDDLDELWSILDDGDGNLSVEEFSLGLRKMKGEAKSKDILLCVKAMRMTDGHLNLLDEKIDTIEINVQKLWGEVQGVETDLTHLFTTCTRLHEAITRAASNAERISGQRVAQARTRALQEAKQKRKDEEAERKAAEIAAELAPSNNRLEIPENLPGRMQTGPSLPPLPGALPPMPD